MGRSSKDKKRYVDKNIKHKYAVKAMLYFQSYGVKNFSMSKMAADLNISKTTIYNHYPSKEALIDAALDYKLDIIGEYETVLNNLTLSYTERYRKSMLFYCVQSFDVSNVLISELEIYYPKIYQKVTKFQKRVILDLKSYYEVGVEIGKFNSFADPLLLALDDQQFFLLLNSKILRDYEYEVLDAFTHHFKKKFQGILVK